MKRSLYTLLSIMAVAMLLTVPMWARSKKGASKGTPAGTTAVIFTGDLAAKVYGYNGPTPLNIHLVGGRIERIEALPNNESPQYFDRAAKSVFAFYQGKTVAEALAVRADAVTGATYSSEALIANIEAGLKSVANASKSSAKTSKPAKKGKRR